nr:MAG: hypothetical protein DIU55_02555 [Bacillota bacterium]
MTPTAKHVAHAHPTAPPQGRRFRFPTLTADSHRSLPAANRSPLTTHYSPLTTHDSPLTSHLSRLTAHNARLNA